MRHRFREIEEKRVRQMRQTHGESDDQSMRQTVTENLNKHALGFPPHSECSHGFKPSVFICRSRMDGRADGGNSNLR